MRNMMKQDEEEDEEEDEEVGVRPV